MSGNIFVDGLLISRNSKTGLSVNFGFSTCRPTAFCRARCYARCRSAGEAKRLGSTRNNGPITMPAAQLAYERNVQVVKEAHRRGPEAISDMAYRLARRLACMTGPSGRIGIDNIRWNGCGDLFSEALPLIVNLAQQNIKVWGFSRRWRMIETLSDHLDRSGVEIPRGHPDRPFFQGSIDPSTHLQDILNLEAATAHLNGRPALVVAASSREEALALRRPSVQVYFGYHATNLKTMLGIKGECPATAGLKGIHCQECRRCIGLPPKLNLDVLRNRGRN